MKTKFAQKGRAKRQDILNDYSNIISIDYLKNVLNSLPYIVAVLNPERQIIFSNKVLINTLHVNSIEDILGLKPGEAIRCINSDKEEDGCGASDNCKFCGTIQTIIESQKKQKSVSQECRIVTNLNGYEVGIDFQVTANPFLWDNEKYTILSLNKINSTKKRNLLESIFFHDFANKVGSLNGFLELIKEVDDPKKKMEFLKHAIEVSNDLSDDIALQRELLASEIDEFIIFRTNIQTMDILKNIIDHVSINKNGENKVLAVDDNSVNIIFKTDLVILKRILINMVINALEASSPGDKVTIGCKHGDGLLIFWVHNPAFISHEIEQQIFKRTFSTKGTNRGLGTYSIKLFTEKYLNGKAYFTTHKKEGTKFYVAFPFDHEFDSIVVKNDYEI
jgi:K+-sensing histidine kinase KdpD